MTFRILVLHGPNLDSLGTREPEIYGTTTLDDVTGMLRRHAGDRAELTVVQSNHEGVLVDELAEARSTQDGVILNAAALTHTSVALRDAIVASGLPVVETHLSNVHAREELRHHTMIGAVCIGVVSGFKADSYRLALDGLLAHLDATRD